MNSLDDLIDQLRDAMGQAWSRVEESSAYNTLRENFDTLPGSTQSIIKNGIVIGAICILFFIPISGILSSSSYVSEYEEKKVIIERLIEAEQLKKKGSPLPPGLSAASMQQRIKGSMQYMKLIEGQGPEMSPLSGNIAGNLASKSVNQSGLSVNFFGLNLKQVLEVGSKLEALDASVKMIGMKVQPSKQFDDYYDASFKLVSFSLPELEANPAESKEDSKKPSRASSRRRGRSSSSSSRRSRTQGK